ncbi:hypothetical protein BHE74_00047974 [Ensete ventricosum]|nr:hypothetical protein BHE74_00047974 [Ensete ventricosum]
MASRKIAHATLKGPSVIKEIVIGLALGLFAGGLSKMHHWNEQRRTRAFFYDMLEKGEISVRLESELLSGFLVLHGRDFCLLVEGKSENAAWLEDYKVSGLRKFSCVRHCKHLDSK